MSNFSGKARIQKHFQFPLTYSHSRVLNPSEDSRVEEDKIREDRTWSLPLRQGDKGTRGQGVQNSMSAFRVPACTLCGKKVINNMGQESFLLLADVRPSCPCVAANNLPENPRRPSWEPMLQITSPLSVILAVLSLLLLCHSVAILVSLCCRNSCCFTVVSSVSPVPAVAVLFYLRVLHSVGVISVS